MQNKCKTPTKTNTSASFFNQKSNRFVLKLFGELNHENFTINNNDQTLTISKTKIDTYENRGQISKWQFTLNQIYSQNTTFEELYENEIENNDFFSNFPNLTQNSKKIITFIGDKNDEINKEPYATFITKCINECLINANTDFNIKISFCEINKKCVVDYLQNSDNIINNPKIIQNKEDIVIENIIFESINNIIDFQKLFNENKTINNNFHGCNKFIDNESYSQLLTLKFIHKNFISKINFVLYKAYEILSSDEVKNDFQFYLEKNKLSKSFNIQFNSNFSKRNNNYYNLYTKDNYNFFSAIQNKINFRLSYIMKYIKDTLNSSEINLFIILLPCEYQYLLLIHDLLDNINMRKFIIENFLVNDKMNLTRDSGIRGSTMLSSTGRFLFDDNSLENESTQMKMKRSELNYDRLKKIENKDNILTLFDLWDNME